MERWTRADQRPQASRSGAAAAPPQASRSGGGAAAVPWRIRSNSSSTPSSSSLSPHTTRCPHHRPVGRPHPNTRPLEPSNDDDTDTFESGRELSLVGTCLDMCPVNERSQRERLRDLAVFERLDGNPGKTSSGLAVKKFSRTISTRQCHASDIRPLPVLQDTLSYLLNLLCCSDHSYEEVHDFIFDRTRSIRQDITMQKMVDEEAITLYEEMVKFHIISLQRLSRINSQSSISSVHLNIEQLTKCLMTLYNMYATNSRVGPIRKNEAEFYSFYVLLHLGLNKSIMGDSLSLWYRKLASPIIRSKQMHFARAALRYTQMGNYVLFFRLLSTEASNLQLCLVEPIINEVRSRAISYVNNSGHKLHSYPLKHLSKLLLLKESDLESLCSLCGLEVINNEEACCKFLPTKQRSFCFPKGFSEHYNFSGSEKLERWQAICTDIRSLLQQ